MKRLLWSVGVLVSLLAPLAAVPVCAQGVTTAAMIGRLTDDAGGAVSQAAVSLLNTSNGQSWSTRTGEDGRFAFENVAVGGPYTVDVRAIGFEPLHAEGILLRLGQRLVFDRTMRRTAVEVAGVSVEGQINPLLSVARTGAQTFVGESLITRLPTLARNFTDFITVVPQVVTSAVPGASVGGQNNRFNNIQVDGGVNNDVFGLAASGTPGGQANAHPISVEAIKEYQVLIAPFDVRQGSFAGGLINAVTKSGTNRWGGSAWGYFQGQALVGPNLGGHNSGVFHQDQYGFNLGGPLVRDKLLFFGSLDVQARGAPFSGLSIGTDTAGGQDSVGIGIREGTATRVAEILASQYGVSAGTFAAPTIGNPDKNAFGKLNLQLAQNSQVELSYNFVSANQDNLVHSSTATGFRDGYQLSNSGYLFTTKTNTARGKWTVQAGRISNELIAGYQRIRDNRNLPNRVPLIFVGGDRPFTGAVPSTNIAAGAERFSHDNLLNQDIFELTDNLTFSRGRHAFTVGTHNEFFHFLNHFFPASLGVWSFRDTTALKAGTPFRYEIALPLRPGGPTADFKVQQFGGYLQDVWAATPRLSLTIALRADVPVQKAPTLNQTLLDTLGINTGDFPSGNILWSPRVGFNYDLSGDGQTRVRGGAGIFSGRPPYVWLSNAYGNTGREQATLICDGATSGVTTDTVPAFTADPDAQPNHCGVGGAGVSAAAASVVYFDPTFKFPQNLKLSLGLDHQLPFGIVGTFDFLYTKSVNQFYLSDVNLRGVQGTVAGEGGRILYGTINTATGATAPVRLSSAFRDVIRHRNESQDRAFQVTGQFEKRFSNSMQFIVGYTYSHVQDLFTLTSSIASSNYRFTTLDGTIEQRNLRRSAFDIPHKISVTGIFSLPADFQVSMVYIGQSGSPYSYVTQNDVNGDGFGGNDPVYVPRDNNDISFVTPSDSVAFDRFVSSESCLQKARGSLMERNSCRNPWINILNARITKVLPSFSGHRIELSADIFNLLHLVNHDWGVLRSTSDFEQANLLNPGGFDTVNQRFRYRLALPQRNRPSATQQQWKVQLGMKYLF
jgi:carboxypeptidase family protein